MHRFFVSAFFVLATVLRAAPYQVLVTNELSGDITVIDPTTNQVVQSLTLGRPLRGISVGPRTGLFYLSSDPTRPVAAGATAPKRLPPGSANAGILVFDPVSAEFVRSFPVATPAAPLAFDKSESMLAAADEGLAEAGLWLISSGHDAARLPTAEGAQSVCFHPTRSLLYVTCERSGELFVFDSISGRKRVELAIGGHPRSIAFLPDGSRAYLPVSDPAEVCVLETQDQKIIRRIAIPGDRVVPSAVVVAPDASAVLVSTGTGNSVLLIEPGSSAIVATIPVGENPVALALSPDGSVLYTANRGSNDVSVVDLATRHETGRIAAGSSPSGIIICAALPESSGAAVRP